MARKHLYGYFRFVDKDGKEHFRKPTPKQRKNILIYYLRRRSSRCMRVADIAAAFHVSERTIQKLLKELETEKIIRRVPVYGASGVQKASKSGLSRTDFLIRTLTNKPVTVIANGGEILQELKRQGNNLNQAVRNCYFYPDEKGKVLSAVAECKRAYRALLFVLGEN